MPHAPAIFRQCRVLRKSRKYPNCYSYSLTDWYSTFLITTFEELRVVAGRNRIRPGRQHAVSGRPILFHTCHAMPMPCCAVALRSHFQNGMVVARHKRDMPRVSQTRPQCINQIGKPQSKHLAARHGRGRTWARHGMYELGFTLLFLVAQQLKLGSRPPHS
jgi:hypothetical protein